MISFSDEIALKRASTSASAAARGLSGASMADSIILIVRKRSDVTSVARFVQFIADVF
jgi:hypothetical protein